MSTTHQQKRPSKDNEGPVFIPSWLTSYEADLILPIAKLNNKWGLKKVSLDQLCGSSTTLYNYIFIWIC